MKLLILNSTNPYYNLAVEEYLFNTAKEDIFMLWQNDKTVVIGKNQNAYAEVNLDYAKNNGILISRRITGGGAVYHDLGNLNYSYISVTNENSGIEFKPFVTPIIEALKTIGVDAELSGRNDIVTKSGKKISGSAQHRQNGRVLHHGTLLFSTDMNVLSNVLSVDKEKLKSKAIKSVSSRVENVINLTDKISGINEFINALKDYLISSCGAEETILNPTLEIERLTERNSSKSWIFPEKSYLSSYTFTNKKRFKAGTVELNLNVDNGVIKSAKIIGDFFGEKPIEELELLIENSKVSEIENKLKEIEISKYILNLSKKEFLSLLI